MGAEYLVCMECKDGMKLTEYDTLPHLVENLDDHGKILGFTQMPKDDRKDFYEEHKQHENMILLVQEKQKFPVSELMSYVEVSDPEGNSFYISHFKERPDLEKKVEVLGKGKVNEDIEDINYDALEVDKVLLEQLLKSIPSVNYVNPFDYVCRYVKETIDVLKENPRILEKKLQSDTPAVYETKINKHVCHFLPAELAVLHKEGSHYRITSQAFDLKFVVEKKVVFLRDN